MTKAARTPRSVSLGWELDEETGEWRAEPVETPLGNDPAQFRIWLRCAGVDATELARANIQRLHIAPRRCRNRVEVIAYAGDLPDTAEARAGRAAEIHATHGPASFCSACARAALGLRPLPSAGAQAPPPRRVPRHQARQPLPHAPVLPVYLRDLIRSGSAPGPGEPRGNTGVWLTAQSELRWIAMNLPADFAAIAPAVLTELRQIRGWLPYWRDFFRIYHPIPEIITS